MKKIELLTLKIVCLIICTLIHLGFCYVTYSYCLEVQKTSWQGSFISAGSILVMGEFFIIWLIFGMDILRSNDI